MEKTVFSRLSFRENEYSTFWKSDLKKTVRTILKVLSISQSEACASFSMLDLVVSTRSLFSLIVKYISKNRSPFNVICISRETSISASVWFRKSLSLSNFLLSDERYFLKASMVLCEGAEVLQD